MSAVVARTFFVQKRKIATAVAIKPPALVATALAAFPLASSDPARYPTPSALGAITALLLGLMGSVVGGWMASGEPMNFTHYRTRKPLYHIG